MAQIKARATRYIHLGMAIEAFKESVNDNVDS